MGLCLMLRYIRYSCIPEEGIDFFGTRRFFKDLLIVILVQYHPSGKTLGVFTNFTLFTAEESILTLSAFIKLCPRWLVN